MSANVFELAVNIPAGAQSLISAALPHAGSSSIQPKEDRSCATQAELTVACVPSSRAQAILLKTCLRQARCAIKLSDRGFELRALSARPLCACGNSHFVLRKLFGHDPVAPNGCCPLSLAHAICQVGVRTNNQSGGASSKGAGAIGVRHHPLRSKALRQFNGALTCIGNASDRKPRGRQGFAGCDRSSGPGSTWSLWKFQGTDPKVRDAAEDEDHRARNQPTRRRGRPQALLPAAHRVSGSVERIRTDFVAHDRRVCRMSCALCRPVGRTRSSS